MSGLVFITGATGGVGSAFTAECARRGWSLYLTDLDPSQLEASAARLEETYGLPVRRHACDLTDPSARTQLFKALRREGVRFRMVINVAGMEYEGSFRERQVEELLTILRLHVEAVVEITHALLPLAEPGVTLRILNVASLAAFFPIPFKATYAASKRFLVEFSLALNEELRGQGASVTVVCPSGMPVSERSLRGIRRQGLMGKLTTLDAGRVAAKSLDRALLGQPLYIPGLVSNVLYFLGRLPTPAGLARFLGRRWRAVHKRTGE